MVPDIDVLPPFLKITLDANDAASLSLPQLCDRYSSYIKESVLNEFRDLGSQAGLRGFEMIKNIYIESEPWTNTGDNPILTPTMKLKRNLAKMRYGTQINVMYDELKSAKGNDAFEAPPRSKL